MGSALFIYVFSFANNSVLHIFLSFFSLGGGGGGGGGKKNIRKGKEA